MSSDTAVHRLPRANRALRPIRRILSSVLIGCSMIGALGMAGTPAPVDINTASAEELAGSLQGIGPARAAAIIEHRESNGAFVQIEDLMAVSGVGPALFEQNRGRLRLGDE